jgi:3-mercaptopyruvate sulfurtransferase SseA
MTDTDNQRLNQNPSETSFSISAQDLKSKLDIKRPLILFDLGQRERYENKHIPGSSYLVCNEELKRIMPKLPKDVEIILVTEND